MAFSFTPDWVSAVASVGSFLVAAIAAYVAYIQYLQPPKQDEEPKEAADEAAVPTTDKLSVFKTSKQNTILKISDAGIDCYIIDDRDGRGGFQWTLNKSAIQGILRDQNFSVEPSYKSKTGLFSIGPRRNWLYSKQIFPEPQYLRGALRELLEKSQIGN